MANDRVYNSTDAAGIKPKLIPNYELMARDDSGGPEYDPHTAQFGDGGYVTGGDEKGHISAKGGTQHDAEGTELSDKPRTRGADNVSGAVPHFGRKNETSRAKKEAME